MADKTKTGTRWEEMTRNQLESELRARHLLPHGQMYQLVRRLREDDTKKYTVDSLIDAAKYGEVDKMKIISEKVDVNEKDYNGYTALHYAARGGHKAICEFLVGKGSDVNILNNYSNTPLHWAAYSGHGETLEFLLSQGAKTDLKNFEGCTALMEACRYEHIHIVKALVNAGSEILETNNKNQNAIDMLAMNEHNDIRTYLRQVIRETGTLSDCDLQKKWKDDERQNLIQTCAARGFFGGKYKFGKSSLVRSLITNRPYLMDKDDRTVVVDLQLWRLSNDVTIPIYDVGGHPCYQQISHLFHSNAINNINVIPHDITSDDYETTYQWITDVVMRSPESSLELLLTKSDKIKSEDNRAKMKEKFTRSMKKYLENDLEMARKKNNGPVKVVQKYEEIAKNIDIYLHTVSCKKEGDPGFKIFRDAIIKKINSDAFKVQMPGSARQLYHYLGKLGVEKKQRDAAKPPSSFKQQETQAVSSSKKQETQPASSLKKQETQPASHLKKQETPLKVNMSDLQSSSITLDTKPEISQDVTETVNKEEPNKEQVQYITFEEAEEIMRKQVKGTSTDVTEELKRCLRYLHHHGLILWFFEQSADLEKLIFNDIGSIIIFLKSLFQHDIKQVFSYDNSITQQIAEPTFKNYVKQLQEEGLLSVQLLSLFAKRFAFQEHVNCLIDILIYLNIAIQTDEPDYIYFPWYVQKKPEKKHRNMIKDVKSTDLNSHCLHLRLSGSIPSAFFNYFTVSMFNYLDPATTSQVRRVWKDSFFAIINNTKIYLDQSMCKNQIDIYIKSSMKITSIRESWNVVKHCDEEIKKLVEGWWPGMMAELYLLCHHCEDAILDTTDDCSAIYHWQLKYILSKECGKDAPCYCPNEIEASIPSVLIHPLPQDDTVAEECLEELRLEKHQTHQEHRQKGQAVTQGRVEGNSSTQMHVPSKEPKSFTQIQTYIAKPFKKLKRRVRRALKKPEKQTSVGNIDENETTLDAALMESSPSATLQVRAKEHNSSQVPQYSVHSDQEYPVGRFGHRLNTQNSALNSHMMLNRVENFDDTEDTVTLDRVPSQESHVQHSIPLQVNPMVQKPPVKLELVPVESSDMPIGTHVDISEHVQLLHQRIFTQGVMLSQQIKSIKQDITDHVTEKADELSTTVTEKADELSSTVTEKADELSTTVTEKADELSTTVTEKADELSTTVHKKTDELSSTVTEKADELSSTVTEKADELSTTVTEKADELSTTVTEKAEELSTTVTEKTEELSTTVTEKTEELSTTVTEKADELSNTVMEKADQVTCNIKLEAGSAASVEASYTNPTLKQNQSMLELYLDVTEDILHKLYGSGVVSADEKLVIESDKLELGKRKRLLMIVDKCEENMPGSVNIFTEVLETCKEGTSNNYLGSDLKKTLMECWRF